VHLKSSASLIDRCSDEIEKPLQSLVASSAQYTRIAANRLDDAQNLRFPSPNLKMNA
jgi:hypothetical protein